MSQDCHLLDGYAILIIGAKFILYSSYYKVEWKIIQYIFYMSYKCENLIIMIGYNLYINENIQEIQ